VLLHGIAPIPASPRPGLAVQVHLADYHPAAAGRTWQHVTAFLSAL